jgi:hypothetical protein
MVERKVGMTKVEFFITNKETGMIEMIPDDSRKRFEVDLIGKQGFEPILKQVARICVVHHLLDDIMILEFDDEVHMLENSIFTVGVYRFLVLESIPHSTWGKFARIS